jgi:hypothetical protein
MSKFKLSVITLFSLFLSGTLFIACNNENVEEPKTSIDVEKVLFEKYNLVKSKNSTIDIANINSINHLNTFDKVDEYTIENSIEKVLVATNSSKPNSFVIIRGINVGNSQNKASKETFEITKELKIEITMDANGNGNLYVKNHTANEEFSTDLINGKPTNLKGIQSDNLASRASLCQRQKGETTSDCYKREVDEFCDGFIGCVALTQVSVHVLILALCTC